MSSRVSLTWDDIAQDSLKLAAHLRQGPQIEGLLAIARGGLIPAAFLARSLRQPLLEMMVATYHGEVAGEPTLVRATNVPNDGDGWVIVDDLVDRGITARFVRKLLPKARMVCLYAKPAGKPFADFTVRDFPQDSWIDFPWEVLEA